VTVILGIVQSLANALALQSSSSNLVLDPGPAFVFMTVLTLTAGTTFVMWLGEQITDRGVGNGMSLLIFAGIVVGLPSGIAELVDTIHTQKFGSFTVPAVVLLIIGMIAVVTFIVWVESAERRIPVQYAKRIVGRRLMGGQSTHLPLKVNSGGVMPIIFAASVLSAPLLFAQSAWVRNSGPLSRIFNALAPGEPWYEFLYIVSIIFFAYFYISIVFRPDDIADNMRKYGGFIPGIRPGKRTSDYVNDILTRITLVGAIYLVVVALIPQLLISGIHLNHLPLVGGFFEHLPLWVTNGMGFNFYFGGTSLLIVVGVAMDTVNQVEAQLIMRHYEGFSARSGRTRGRRAW
jgi:preprotein translocase subunit SecY